jgi:transposase
MTRRPAIVEQHEMAERQERAWHLVVVRRLSEREAAEILGIHEKTLRNDLKAMRARGAKVISNLATQRNVLQLAAEMWAQLSSVLREAWVSVQAAEPASPVRVRALNTVRATVRDMADVLQSLGLLPKAPEEVLISAKDPGQLNDTQLEAAVAFFLALASDSPALGASAGEPPEPAALDRAESADPDQG